MKVLSKIIIHGSVREMVYEEQKRRKKKERRDNVNSGKVQQKVAR